MSNLPRELAQAEVLIGLGRDREAEERLRALLAEHPQSPAVLRTLARALHHQDRLAEADELASRSVALAPESQDGHLVLCDIRLSRELWADADRSARECLRLEPHDWTSHYAMARVLLSGPRPRLREAYDAARTSVGLAPDQPAAHNLVGLCLDNLGNRDEAERAYRNALAIDPGHTMAQNNLATLQMERGRLGHGARMLRQAVSQAPQEKVLHQNLHRILLLLGRRALIAIATAGIVLGAMIAQDAPWWSRALVGAAFLAGLGWLLHRFRANLPRGVGQWGREALAAVPRRWQLFYGLLVLVVLLLAFAPASIAGPAGLGFLGLARVVGLVVILGWLGGALLNLVRRR
ncbi:tetratricopeptide repeat protein [Nocardioides rotundus]|uniref:tetratricopeptide repeat protein n=1 Tax=Nocardioides rotundus TaxID=1774216 RepID=UPI001CBD9FB5|nr:tetratricopeptide repeat protein [Nocardioides rotundus]UAL28808.1 tetratricopeptide repeat protein [Nocardioides rotundus]